MYSYLVFPQSVAPYKMHSVLRDLIGGVKSWDDIKERSVLISPYCVYSNKYYKNRYSELYHLESGTGSTYTAKTVFQCGNIKGTTFSPILCIDTTASLTTFSLYQNWDTASNTGTLLYSSPTIRYYANNYSQSSMFIYIGDQCLMIAGPVTSPYTYARGFSFGYFGFEDWNPACSFAVNGAVPWLYLKGDHSYAPCQNNFSSYDSGPWIAPNRVPYNDPTKAQISLPMARSPLGCTAKGFGMNQNSANHPSQRYFIGGTQGAAQNNIIMTPDISMVMYPIGFSDNVNYDPCGNVTELCDVWAAPFITGAATCMGVDYIYKDLLTGKEYASFPYNYEATNPLSATFAVPFG